MYGNIDLPKVPGKLIFMTSDAQNVLMGLITGGNDKVQSYQKFNFDHFFRHLRFGEQKD